jgi:cytochrome o ubiquinol oxidase subunit 1
VKVFNWIFTMYRGRVKFATPMLWFMGFVVTFTIGGLTGVLMSVPAIDFQVHNSLFLVAHFHNMIIGGVLFGVFAGFTYWFPKFTGFKLNERLGRYAFWSWLIGFLLAFIPLYILGIMGATRRLDHYDASMGWQGLFVVAGIGVMFIGLGIAFQLLQIGYSIWKRKENRVTGDPWNGRTLEWATSSPPPEYNFAIIPVVHERDAFWTMKQRQSKDGMPNYQPISVPKNSPLGLVIAVCAFMVGFGIVWHIVWMAALGLVGIVITIIVRISSDETERIIPVEEIMRTEALTKGVR